MLEEERRRQQQKRREEAERYAVIVAIINHNAAAAQRLQQQRAFQQTMQPAARSHSRSRKARACRTVWELPFDRLMPGLSGAGGVQSQRCCERSRSRPYARTA